MGYASGRTPSRPVFWNPEIVKSSSLRSLDLHSMIGTQLSVSPEIPN
jgi:hypothetical protein